MKLSRISVLGEFQFWRLVQRCSVKRIFLKNSKISQKIDCVGISFLVTLKAEELQL